MALHILQNLTLLLFCSLFVSWALPSIALTITNDSSTRVETTMRAESSTGNASGSDVSTGNAHAENTVTTVVGTSDVEGKDDVRVRVDAQATANDETASIHMSTEGTEQEDLPFTQEVHSNDGSATVFIDIATAQETHNDTLTPGEKIYTFFGTLSSKIKALFVKIFS